MFVTCEILRFKFLFVAASLFSLNPIFALELLLDGSEAMLEQQVRSQMSRLDRNKDGRIEKAEDARFWRQNASYDRNKDRVLDLAELKGIPVSQMDSPGKRLLHVLFKRVGDKGVYLDCYFPDDDSSRQKPVVLFTHGGGWAAGDKAKAGRGGFKTVHRALLKDGFCVVSVGYRKITKDSKTAMRDCVIDSQDALRFVSAHHEELGIDPNQIFTFGDSAGGHLAQMVLLSSGDDLKGDPELAQFRYQTVAGVSWYGPCDFQDVQLFNHNDRKNFRDRFGPRIMGGGTQPSEKKERYREMSPVSYLTKESPPLLMIQGDKDTTIPVKQAYRMQEALKEIPAPVEILIVKNAGHNWRSVDAPIEPSREEIVARTIAFFLKNR